ncbi:MAG: 5'/3'-nucleotidase SurE [Planctomycetota bacterium]
MRILLTNDDGILAPGILALHDALVDARGEFGGPLGELLWPVAPLTVQSATSHGVTFHTPLMVSEESIDGRMSGLAVDGRPADCVKLAICSLWPEQFGQGQRPDLVISGMNAGANVGINVIYSGTVAAALEAAFLGVPSIAVSLHLGKGKARFDLAARRARNAIEALIAGGIGAEGALRPHDCISINIPRTEQALGSGERADTPHYELEPVWAKGLSAPVPAEDMPPLRVCPMNTHALVDAYERRTSPSGQRYYWAAGSGLNFLEADEGTDVDLLFRGNVTVTPLRYDLTERDELDRWRQQLGVE